MEKNRRSVILALVVFLSLPFAPLPSFANPDAVETGRLLAILLDAGRVVVGTNQPLINDKEKGDKGFTPDVFEKQLHAKFKERSGVDLGSLQSAKVPDQAKALLPALVLASKEAVAENQIRHQ